MICFLDRTFCEGCPENSGCSRDIRRLDKGGDLHEQYLEWSRAICGAKGLVIDAGLGPVATTRCFCERTEGQDGGGGDGDRRQGDQHAGAA